MRRWCSIVSERTYHSVVSGSCPMQEASKTATRQVVMTGKHVHINGIKNKGVVDFHNVRSNTQCSLRSIEAESCISFTTRATVQAC